MKLVFLIVPILGTILTLLGIWNDDLFPFSMLGEFLFPVLHCILTHLALKNEQSKGKYLGKWLVSLFLLLATKSFVSFCLEPLFVRLSSFVLSRNTFRFWCMRCAWSLLCFAVFQLFRRELMERWRRKWGFLFLVSGAALAVHALLIYLVPNYFRRGDGWELIWFFASSILLSIVSFYLGMVLRDAKWIWSLLWLLGVAASTFVCMVSCHIITLHDFLYPLSLTIFDFFSVGIWMWYPIGRLLGRRFDKKREVL